MDWRHRVLFLGEPCPRVHERALVGTPDSQVGLLHTKSTYSSHKMCVCTDLWPSSGPNSSLVLIGRAACMVEVVSEGGRHPVSAEEEIDHLGHLV